MATSFRGWAVGAASQSGEDGGRPNPKRGSGLI